MAKILVFTELHGNHVKGVTLEILGKLAGHTVEVAAVGSIPAEGVGAQEIAHHGVQEVHLSKESSFDAYNPELFAAAVAEAIQKSGATVVLASASAMGKDLFPRVAAKLNCGLVSDGVELTIAGEDVKVKKPLYAGKCFATASFENSPVKIVLMRANQLPVAAGDTAKTANITEHTFAKPNLKTLIKEIVKGASEKLDLTEANIIVSGGRGLKEAGNFKMLQDLADVLGATVGATRAVVDAGWVGHSMQVGQTGKTVAPTLYIAVGLSGAIQHLAGMSGSKVIVAINNDANAPIFQKATYGIVGDAFEIVPQLTEEFKKVLHT